MLKSKDISEHRRAWIAELFDQGADRGKLAQQGLLDSFPAKPPSKIRTGEHLLSAQLDPPRWAIADVLCEGIALLVGPPKIGKSSLVLNWTLAIASGGKAMGRIEVAQGDVLYLALEDSERRLQHRICLMTKIDAPIAASHQATPASAAGNDYIKRIHYATTWPRLDEGGLEQIEDFIAGHPDTRLVVIDTLQRVRQKPRTQNAYAADYESIGPIHRMAMDKKLAILFLHHTRKGAADDDDVEAVSGTLGLAGAVDTVIRMMHAPDGGAQVILSIQGRDVSRRKLALRGDASTLSWTILGDAAEFAQAETRQDIINTLRSKGPMRISADESHAPCIIIELNKLRGDNGKPPVKRGTLGKLLWKMAQAGIVSRDPQHRYSLNAVHLWKPPQAGRPSQKPGNERNTR